MNLFKELIITAPVSNRLQFGFNENVIISAVDTATRMIKGLPVKANTYITFTQINPESKKVLAQSEFNFYNLDSTSDLVVNNFLDEFTVLVSIIEALGKDTNAFETSIFAALNTTADNIDAIIKTKEGAKVAQDTLQNSFYEIVKDSIGENCPLMKCKLLINKKGYLEIPKVQGWILPMSSTEELPEITSAEIKTRTTALSATTTQAKPDTLGAPKASTTEKKVSVSGFSGL